MTTDSFVVEYRPEWPELFEEERARLLAVFDGTGAVIEHVGSTAVPGLAAKPVIDIAIGLSDVHEAEERADALTALGYEYVPEYEAEMPDRRYFRRPRRRPRTHHVHCVVHGGRRWTRYLALRDVLRRRPDLAAEYASLKRDLAARCADDRSAYTESKGPFIERVLGEGPTMPVEGRTRASGARSEPGAGSTR